MIALVKNMELFGQTESCFLMTCQKSTKITEEVIYKLSEFYMMDFIFTIK